MCEQAARYCRAGVQRLLRKPPPALRGLDGLLRWVVARMGDKAVAERELLNPGAAAAQRKGTSVILDVSGPPGRRGCTPRSSSRTRMPAPAAPPARIRHPLGIGGIPRVLHPHGPVGEGLYPGSCHPRLGGHGGASCPLARVPQPRTEWA